MSAVSETDGNGVVIMVLDNVSSPVPMLQKGPQRSRSFNVHFRRLDAGRTIESKTRSSLASRTGGSGEGTSGDAYYTS